MMQRDPLAEQLRGMPDTAAARRDTGWILRERLGRGLWEAVRGPLFAWTPRSFFWGWRRAVLRTFGAKVGKNVHIHPSVKIAVPWNLCIGEDAAVGDGARLYSLGMITIGAGATISQLAHLCAGTHDFRNPAMPLMKEAVVIGAGAWICADAFIGPGVEIGNMAVVGARSTVMRNVAPGDVVAGNPARIVGKR